MEKKTPYVILHFTVLMIGFLLIHGGCAKRIPQETNDAKAFQEIQRSASSYFPMDPYRGGSCPNGSRD